MVGARHIGPVREAAGDQERRPFGRKQQALLRRTVALGRKGEAVDLPAAFLDDGLCPPVAQAHLQVGTGRHPIGRGRLLPRKIGQIDDRIEEAAREIGGLLGDAHGQVQPSARGELGNGDDLQLDIRKRAGLCGKGRGLGDDPARIDADLAPFGRFHPSFQQLEALQRAAHRKGHDADGLDAVGGEGADGLDDGFGRGSIAADIDGLVEGFPYQRTGVVMRLYAIMTNPKARGDHA